MNLFFVLRVDILIISNVYLVKILTQRLLFDIWQMNNKVYYPANRLSYEK